MNEIPDINDTEQIKRLTADWCPGFDAVCRKMLGTLGHLGALEWLNAQDWHRTAEPELGALHLAVLKIEADKMVLDN